MVGQQGEGFGDGGGEGVAEQKDQGFNGSYGHGKERVFAEKIAVGFRNAVTISDAGCSNPPPGE